MRQIHQASLVFHLKDMLTKSPITDAVIFLNDKALKCIRKNDGHYVFSELPDGIYDVSIVCNGYLDVNFNVPLKNNETLVFSFNLPYAVNNKTVMKVPRFEITVLDDKVPVVNEEITLKIKNKLDFLKLLNPIEENTFEAALTSDFNIKFVDQGYIYKTRNKEYRLFFNGYNPDTKAYVLREIVPEKIETGGVFIPFWEIKTDKYGRAILPAFSQFMKESKIKFELDVYGKKANFTGDISKIQNNIVYVKARVK